MINTLKYQGSFQEGFARIQRKDKLWNFINPMRPLLI